MKQKDSTNTQLPYKSHALKHSLKHFHIKEISLLLLITVSIFLLLALISYHALDLNRTHIYQYGIQNAAGKIGAYISRWSFKIFGFSAFLLPVVIIYVSLRTLLTKQRLKTLFILTAQIIGGTLLIAASCFLESVLLEKFAGSLPKGAGGDIGSFIAIKAAPLFGIEGSILITVIVLLISITLISGLSWIKLTAFIGRGIKKLAHAMGRLCKKLFAKKSPDSPNIFTSFFKKLFFCLNPINWLPKRSKEHTPTKKKQQKQKTVKINVVEAQESNSATPDSNVKHGNSIFSGEIPDIALLDMPKEKSHKLSDSALQQTSTLVEEKLADFGIKATVVGVCPGPVVTRFELELAPGIKVSKLTGLAKDLARSLSVSSVRVVEIIPGKTVVGVELPNVQRQIVRLREVLDVASFRDSKSTLTMALG
ncbi:MAG: hypothetical protein COB50_04965, partial [Thiotrichales bacterium]